MPWSITLIKLWVHFESKNKLPVLVLLFMPRHLIAIPSTQQLPADFISFLIVHSLKKWTSISFRIMGKWEANRLHSQIASGLFRFFFYLVIWPLGHFIISFIYLFIFYHSRFFYNVLLQSSENVAVSFQHLSFSRVKDWYLKWFPWTYATYELQLKQNYI